MSDGIPIVCSLTEPEMRERRAGLLGRVRARVVAARPIGGLRASAEGPPAAAGADATGWEVRFPGDAESVAEILELVRLESRCCAFLGFRVTVEPGAAGVVLEISGPPAGAEILARELVPGLAGT